MLTQEQRFKMIESFRETNGEEVAMSLAEGFDELATKEDVGKLEGRFDKLEERMDSQFRWLMGGMWGCYGAIIAALGIGIAVMLRVT